MTEEEKEAIERLNRIITTKFNNDYSIDSLDKEAIETVLNMLKEKDKEIEFQKDIRNTEKNRHKKTEKSLKGIINKQNTELAEKNAEIEKLNRQKDLMAEEIEKGDIEFTEYCNFKIVCDRNCKECIKKYFERKVEE